MAPGLAALGNDLLLSLDKDAVLVAAGEMDGFAVLARQHGGGKRMDVLVVDQRLLEDAAYRSRAWSKAGAQGAVPSGPAEFISRLYRSTDRPVYLSMALGRSAAAPLAGALHPTGIALRMSDGDCCSMAALRNIWAQMAKPMDAGPLSRNYLVAGGVLLKHYRAEGDERRATELELELRRMGERLGMLRQLYETGLLAH
jgi:hypothetical protein